MALPKKYRLKGSLVFKNIRKKGRLFQSESFGLGIIFRNDLEVSRFGIVVSSKISKKAIIRNRIRRIIFEVVRKMIPKMKKGHDVVFLTKPNILTKQKLETEDEVVSLFKEIGLI